MEETGPRERLVKTAIDLFYKQGYEATSVNHIIEASATHKASFYRYFKSKEELGEEYLNLQGKIFNEGWIYLMAKTDSPQGFVNTWVSLLKRQVRSGNFFGCPVAKFMSSSEKPNEIVVVSAHYDHVGVKNGEVYNGADDDGSGKSR